MKIDTVRADAQRTIAIFKEREGQGLGMPECGAAPVLNARRMLEIADIAESMSDQEWERIHQVPVYMNDMRVCRDIKERYALSWNELRALRGFER